MRRYSVPDLFRIYGEPGNAGKAGDFVPIRDVEQAVAEAEEKGRATEYKAWMKRWMDKGMGPLRDRLEEALRHWWETGQSSVDVVLPSVEGIIRSRVREEVTGMASAQPTITFQHPDLNDGKPLVLEGFKLEKNPPPRPPVPDKIKARTLGSEELNLLANKINEIIDFLRRRFV